ncbi:hypothetical protein [Roseibium alexandrii]|uniref:hypothetical protein n=1 Tax=Roseibium alexandrii TaxID=388408 RepID=UPI0037535F3C
MRRETDQRFRANWSSAQVAKAAFLLGRGRTAREVSEFLGVGIWTIQRMKRYWGLTSGLSGRGTSVIPVQIDAHARKKLAVQAEAVGCTPEEFLRRVTACAIEDSMYAAITDGRFD